MQSAGGSSAGHGWNTAVFGLLGIFLVLNFSALSSLEQLGQHPAADSLCSSIWWPSHNTLSPEPRISS